MAERRVGQAGEYEVGAIGSRRRGRGQAEADVVIEQLKLIAGQEAVRHDQLKRSGQVDGPRRGRRSNADVAHGTPVQASRAEPAPPNWKVYQTPLRIPVACAAGAIPPISAIPSAIEPSRFFSFIKSPCMIAGEPGHED